MNDIDDYAFNYTINGNRKWICVAVHIFIFLVKIEWNEFRRKYGGVSFIRAQAIETMIYSSQFIM